MEKNLLLNKAKGAEMSHDFATAARLYKELVAADPSNVEYLKSLANIFVQSGEDEKAIPYFEQIIAYYPHYIEAMTSLGAIYRRLKRYEDSLNILERAFEEGRQIPSVNYNLGFTQKEMGNYKDAINSFESVIAVNPNDVLAHNHLGSIYLALKDYTKSIASFKQGLQIDQNHPILNYNLARCYEAAKNIPDAIRCYGLALKTRPGWIDAIRDFSSLLIKCQKNKEAQELVQQTLKIRPNDTEMISRLGQIYLNEYDFEKAAETFKKARTLNEEDVTILTGLSKAYEKNGKFGQATDIILDALKIAPENKEVRKQCAHTYLSEKEYDRALEMIDSLYKDEDGDKDLEVLDLYGQYYICNKQPEKAKEMYSKIQRINHHYKDYLIDAARRFAQIGDFEKAELYANDYVQRRPQNPDGFIALGDIYEAKGDLIGAKNFFGKTASMNKSIVYAVKKVAELTDKLNDVTQFPPLQDIEVGDPIEKDDDQVVVEEVNSQDESFDYNQMGGNPIDEIPVVDTESYFNKIADNLEEEFSKEVEEEDNYFEFKDPDKMELIDEDNSSFSFEEEEEKVNPLKQDNGGEFFNDEEDYSPQKVLPKMEKMNEQAQESANVAREAVENAQKLINELNNQKAMLQEQLAAQQQLLQDQMKQHAQSMVKEAVCDFLETTPAPEPVAAPKNSAQNQSKFTVSEFGDEEEIEESDPDFKVEVEEPEESAENFEEASVEIPEESADVSLEESLENSEEYIEENPSEDFSIDDSLFENMLGGSSDEDSIEEENSVEPAVEKPVFEQPIATESPVEEAVSEEPVTEESAVEEPISEEPVAEESAVGEAISEESPVGEAVSEEPAAEESPVGEPVSEESAVEEPVSEEPISENPVFFSDYQFDTVESIFGEEESSDEESPVEEPVSEEPVAEESPVEEAVSEEPVAEESAVEEPISEEPAAEESAVEEPISEEQNELFAEDMVEKIQKILRDDKIAQENVDKLELFKSFRLLSSFLPENEKNTFQSCRMRMMNEYIIAKLSGKPGLLLTAQSLIKSGVLGEEYEAQLTKECDYEMGNELIRKVMKDMKKMSENLEDKSLAQSLSVTADGILEQIELRNQKSEIF